MKNILKYIFILMVAGVFTGCEDYLDEPKPTDQLTSVDIYGSREGVEAYVSGIYRKFRTQHASTTDVGGIYSMYFARTIKGNDLIQSPTWYLYDYANDNREPSYRRVRETWILLYDLIDHANTLIQGVDESEALSDIDKKELIAHGKALRAYFYFQLALEYQAAYPAAGADAFAPPIYKMSTSEPGSLSTMGEMYTFMLEDIDEAIGGLTDERLGKSYINKTVAYGIKTRILMAMGSDTDWEEVENCAKAAYGGNISDAVAGDYTDGFDDIQNSNWIWGLDQQDDQSNYYYAAPHAFTDHYVLSYAATFINSNFVNTFSNTDVRKLFVNGYGAPVGHWQEFITTKFAFSFTSDIPTMRKSEMLLAEAEAKAYQNKYEEAQELLYALQVARDPSAVASGNSGQDLIDEILLERRKELYGEIGVEWFDAKRNMTGITRDENHRVTLTLEPNDPRFYLKIPEVEINANPNIDASINTGR